MIYIKIIGVIALSVVLVIIVRETNPSYSAMVSVLVGVILLYFSMQYMIDIYKYLAKIIEKININKDYFFILIKIIVIAYLTEFVSQFAIDNNQTNMASKAQLIGKIAVFYISLPIITSLFEFLEEML